MLKVGVKVWSNEVQVSVEIEVFQEFAQSVRVVMSKVLMFDVLYLLV